MSIVSLFRFQTRQLRNARPADRANETRETGPKAPSLGQVMASSRARAWIPAHLIESLDN